MSMWGGSFDSDLSSKIDQMLAGRSSAQQRVEDFMADELHVDPTKIPLSYKDARDKANKMMGDRDAGSCRFQGTSMGLAYVDFTENQDDQPSNCALCGASGYFYKQGNGKYECDDCEKEFDWSPPNAKVTRVTERTDATGWIEFQRIYKSLCKNYVHSHQNPSDGDDTKLAPADIRFTKFTITHAGWGEPAVTGVVDPKPKWKRPAKYPTGTRLQVTDGTDTFYVRIGGLFSDDDVVNLATMKPIEKISALTVVEVLDDE